VALNVDLTFAEVSPAQDYLLGVDASGVLYWVDLRQALPAARTIVAAINGADRVVISPSGGSAAAYDRQSGEAQVLTNLHTSPNAGARLDVGSLPGVVTALAVSDNGQTLLTAVAGRDSGAIYSFAAGGSPTLTASVGRVTSLSFLANSGDALAADLDRSEVLRIGSGGAAVIASASDGVLRPTAVTATSDNRTALIASADSPKIAMVPLDGGAAIFVDCACAARQFSALAGDSLFRLNSDVRQPILLLDAGRTLADGVTPDPRVLFVPARTDLGAPPAVTINATPTAVRGRR
jgi:hypothetical protein